MKKFYICCNRDTPYVLYISDDKKTAWVYYTVTGQIIKKFENILKVFPGKDSEFYGNSVLLQTGPLKYVFVGEMIYQFSTKEPVLNYISTMGNNLVPYPYAITKNSIYLVLDKRIVPGVRTKPYEYYYSLMKKIPNPFEEFYVEIIAERGSPDSGPIGYMPLYYYIYYRKKIKDHEFKEENDNNNNIIKYYDNFIPDT